MSIIKTRVSDTVDLNVAIGNGAADANIVYSLSKTLARAASINPSTGVITPSGPGAGFVYAHRVDNGLLVTSVVVHIVSDSQYAYDGSTPSSTSIPTPPGFVALNANEKGALNGVASLDGDGKLDAAQVPDGMGQMTDAEIIAALGYTPFEPGNGSSEIFAGPIAFSSESLFNGGIRLGPGAQLLTFGESISERAAAINLSSSSFVTGDTFARFQMLAGGKINWGSGSGSLDTNLYRNSAGVLKTDGSLIVGVDLTINGNFVVNGTTTTINSTVVNVADKLVHYNHPATNDANDPVPTAYSGFTIHRGTVAFVERSHAGLVWDEAAQKFRASFMLDDTTLGAALGLSVAGFDATSVVVSGTSSFAGTMSFSTTGSIAITAASAASSSRMTMKVTGDATPRWQMLGDGKMEWGGGAAALDTNLYRSAANTLKTDDAFIAASGTFSNVFIGNVNGTSTDAGLSTKTSTKALSLEGYNGVRGKHNCYFDGSTPRFMSAAAASRFDLTGTSFTIGFSTNTPAVDGTATIATRFTLSSAGLLTLGDGLVATTGTLSGQWSWTRSLATDYCMSSKVTGDTLSRFAARTDGVLEWGDGAATGRDTKLYRSEPYGLKTDGGFRSGGFRTVQLANTANKWCQVLKITLNTQYDVASGTLKVIRAGNNAGATGPSAVADLYFRFKQQGTMAGASPKAELLMPFGMGLDPSDFKLVVTTDNGTTKEAYLYARQTVTWDYFKYNLLAEASWPLSAITMLNNVAFEDDLPAGAQYSCTGGVLVDNLTGTVSTVGDLTLATAGKLLKVKGGSNSAIGTATLVAGAVTVSNTLVAAGDMIVLTASGAGGTQGFLSYTISAGTSFTVNSSSNTDTSTVEWMIVRQI